MQPLTGTVTAVGTSTVTIKTSTATTTYSVTSTTTIEKFAQGSLDGVKVGDTVSFETTTTGGTVLGPPHGRQARVRLDPGAAAAGLRRPRLVPVAAASVVRRGRRAGAPVTPGGTTT